MTTWKEFAPSLPSLTSLPERAQVYYKGLTLTENLLEIMRLKESQVLFVFSSCHHLLPPGSK